MTRQHTCANVAPQWVRVRASSLSCCAEHRQERASPASSLGETPKEMVDASELPPPPWLEGGGTEQVLLSSRGASRHPRPPPVGVTLHRPPPPPPPPPKVCADDGGSSSMSASHGRMTSAHSTVLPWMQEARSPVRVAWRPEWLADDDDHRTDEDGSSTPPTLLSPVRRPAGFAGLIDETCDASSLSAPVSPARCCDVCGCLYSAPVCRCAELAMAHPITKILARARSSFNARCSIACPPSPSASSRTVSSRSSPSSSSRSLQPTGNGDGSRRDDDGDRSLEV